ncbi:MAG TPA: gluconokinase [Alphaproteobacteria bacterium]|nr:gluconokinase [Alphaproteobacteria bacterium]
MTAPHSRVIIVMGVSGSGKSTVGQRLAAELGWPFYEGDDFHPQVNVDKMRQGIPLTDHDRAPWLTTLRRLIDDVIAAGQSAVIACSALKQAYRDRLAGPHREVQFVYLKGSYALIRQRMLERQGHFMRAGLLASQFDTLEEPEDALTVDIAQEPQVIVAQIRRALQI